MIKPLLLKLTAGRRWKLTIVGDWQKQIEKDRFPISNTNFALGFESTATSLFIHGKTKSKFFFSKCTNWWVCVGDRNTGTIKQYTCMWCNEPENELLSIKSFVNVNRPSKRESSKWFLWTRSQWEIWKGALVTLNSWKMRACSQDVVFSFFFSTADSRE